MMNTDMNRLYRSRSERMLGGVCGGLGKFLGIDPTVIRLVFVLAAVLGFVGPAVIGYLVLLLVVPEEPAGAAAFSVFTPEPPSESVIEPVEPSETL
jgi:phage shock protein C